MPIKTLHLTNYWHERSGGIATFYRQLLQAANREGRCMILIVPGERDEVHEFGSGSRIYQLKAPPAPLNDQYRTIYPHEYLLGQSKIQGILAAERPELVEICDKYSLIYLAPLLRLGLARGVDFRPVVVGLSCERMDENFAAYLSKSWWARLFPDFYIRQIYFPFFDHHIANSEHTADELRRASHGHLVARGTWIRPMGVDTERFCPEKRSAEVRRELLQLFDNPERAVLLLYAGRLVPEKNLGLLIETMAELKKNSSDFRMLVVGDGIARPEIARYARESVPGHFAFLGHIQDRDRLARIYASCDLFVHPNPREPFGIGPLEAMASGLPLLAPNRGGVTSYANHENAYLAAPRAQEFAAAALRAAGESQARAEKARAARVTAESYSWPAVAASFFSLYDQLYSVGTGPEEAMSAASPAFVSTPATRGQRWILSGAASLAKAAFSAYAAVSARFGRVRHEARDFYKTKVETM